MAIDYDAIRDKFIVVIKDGVGGSLAQIGQAGSRYPAVIKRRPDAPKPDYPYIDIDVLSTKDEGGWASDQGVDENGFLFYATHKQLLINIRCYGGDAQNIMNSLSGYLRQLHIVQDDLRATLGSSIVTVFDITSMPVKLSDKWIESADFNLIFNTIDTITDTTSGYGEIDTVHLDGGLLRHTDDASPLPIEVDVP